MKWFAAVASFSISVALIACQAENKESRPGPKATPTTPPEAAPPAAVPPAIVGSNTTPPAPTGNVVNPGVPAGATGGLNGAPCSATEQAIPTGPTEAAYRQCCDQLIKSKACLDTAHKCWAASVFPDIQKGIDSGVCKPVAAAGAGLTD